MRTRAVSADYRTAAEKWLAGEKVTHPKKSEYKKSCGAQSVVVTFADGESMRVSTYLDGQSGLNEVARFCRTARQFSHIGKRLAWQGNDIPGTWIQDSAGCWRCIPKMLAVPAIVSVEYADDCALRSIRAA